MKVTLKKASEIARAAISAGEKINIRTTLTISAFSSTSTIPTGVENARERISQDIKSATALIAVGYTIRAQIGAENFENGVDGLLTQVAMLDKQMSVFSFIEATTSYGYGSMVASDDMDALIKRVERTASTETHSGDLTVNLIDEEAKAAFTDAVADLKRQRVALKDQITALNFTSHITLGAEDVEFLRAEKVI